MRTFIGAQHNALLDWLSWEWWQIGPTACIVQGFPGAGKTEIADRLEDRLKKKGVQVVRAQCPAHSVGAVDDLVLSLAQAFSERGDDRLAKSPSADTLLQLLKQQLLIVLDEFQESFGRDAAKPTDQLANFVERLSGRRDLAGRVLCLSSRLVADERWNERCEKRELFGLAPEEGELLLGELLESTNLPVDSVLQARRQDVSKWLGGYPRAIELLVRSLRRQSLDELIGSEPEGWEARDQEVSADLLKRIETQLLSRARSGLAPDIDRFFERLAVFRRPVNKHALEAVSQGVESITSWRDELIARYLLQHRRGFYTLHPVLRETVLRPLGDATLQHAHAMAGKHYGRHFLAKQMVGAPAKLGGAFIEARYHYTKCGDVDQLRKIAGQFESYIRARMSWVTPVPTDIEEVNERIGLLSALLQSEGAKSLHYYLARLLERRNRPGDLQRAVMHAKHGTGPQSPHDAWLLRLRLIERCNGWQVAIFDLKESGLKVLASEKNLFALYQAAAEILASNGKADDAVALLKDGIGKVAPQFSLSSLYQAAAEILARNGKADDAVALLKDGIGKVAPQFNLYVLYLVAADILARNGKADDAVALLKHGIGKVRPQFNLSSLYEAAAEILARNGKADDAVALLKDGIGKVAPQFGLSLLYLDAAELLHRDGNAQAAIALLNDGIGKIAARFDQKHLVNAARRYANTAFSSTTEVGRLDEDPDSPTEAIVPLRDPVPVVVPQPPSIWNPAQILTSMRPDGWSGLYILGSFDRRITFFTQQARALTLVRALFDGGDLQAGQRVAVVGAGAAGSMAAVAAARKGCHVTLYDEHDAVLYLQAAANHRFLHPHIYDWPQAGSTNPDAGLPFLNWIANEASEVVVTLRDEFQRHLSEMPDRLLFRPKSKIIRIKSDLSKQRINLLGNEAAINETYHLVLLAVGFGFEVQPFPNAQSTSYWGGDTLDGPFAAKRCILVSGSGDGGLIDLARSTLRSDDHDTFFHHHRAVEWLTSDPAFERLANDMYKIDTVGRRNASLGRSVNLYQEYQKLSVEPSLIARFRLLRRSDTNVTFNFRSESVFSLDSSLLNRLLAFLLLKAELVVPKFGTVISVDVSPSNTFKRQVVISGPPDPESTDHFDIVVLRYGPPPNAFDLRFPDLADACKQLRGKMTELALTLMQLSG